MQERITVSICCWVVGVSRVLFSGAKRRHVGVDMFPMAFLRVTGAPLWHLGLVGVAASSRSPSRRDQV